MAIKYYYIKSNDLYLNGKENVFYPKLLWGTFTNNKLEAEKIQLHHTNIRQQEYNSITGNTKKDKARRIELQKELELYKNSEVVEVPEEDIINAQNLVKANAIFMREVYAHFLTELKDNLRFITKHSKNDLKVIKDSLKVLKSTRTEFERFAEVEEDMTYDFQEEYIKFIDKISNIGYYEPQFLNDWIDMMNDEKGLATMKRALKRWNTK